MYVEDDFVVIVLWSFRNKRDKVEDYLALLIIIGYLNGGVRIGDIEAQGESK